MTQSNPVRTLAYRWIEGDFVPATSAATPATPAAPRAPVPAFPPATPVVSRAPVPAAPAPADEAGLRGEAPLRKSHWAAVLGPVLPKPITVNVWQEGPRFVVKSPFNRELAVALARVPGRHWDAQRQVNLYPLESREALFDTLVSSLPEGSTIVGTRRTVVL